MYRHRAVLAFVLVAAGLVWIGQGTGRLAGRSFMVGDPRWTVIGGVCVVVGLVLGWRELRRRARPD
jgi:hypothetical protein